MRKIAKTHNHSMKIRGMCRPKGQRGSSWHYAFRFSRLIKPSSRLASFCPRLASFLCVATKLERLICLARVQREKNRISTDQGANAEFVATMAAAT